MKTARKNRFQSYSEGVLKAVEAEFAAMDKLLQFLAKRLPNEQMVQVAALAQEVHISAAVQRDAYERELDRRRIQARHLLRLNGVVGEYPSSVSPAAHQPSNIYDIRSLLAQRR